MTARKSTPKATVAHAPTEHDALGSMLSWLNENSTGTPHVEFSIARTMSALIGGLTAGGTLAYFGLQVIEVIAIAAFAYTGFTFLAFMVGFIGMALTLIGAFVITGKVQEYILSGGIDRTYESSKALATEKIAVVKGWFKTRGEKVVDHAASSAASVYETLNNCKAKTFRSCDHA